MLRRTPRPESPSAAPVRPRSALAVATLAAAASAAVSACSPAGGQPAEGGQQGAPPPAVRVDSSAPRADSGVVSVARSVTPAVVYIEVESAPRTAARGQGQGVPPGFPRELLPPGFQLPDGPQQRGPARGSGSGFIVSPNGYILTNNHVVADADRVTVTLYDRRIFTARVIGRDPSTDVALIKIDGTGLPTAVLGDDRQVQVGQPVVAIGNPLGLRSTVTSGIVSAKERSSLGELLNNRYAVSDFIQTDAAINPGNSGGPLVDLAGRVIGINSAIQSPTGTYAGYGFAVPVGIARTAMDQFLKYGRVRRAILGVSISDVRPADARAAGLNTISGALVGGVTDEGGARAAGLQPGDVITAVNNRPIGSVAVLQRTVYGYQPGQTVNVTVQRFGAQRTLAVTLREAPAEQHRRRGAAAPGGALAGVVAQAGHRHRAAERRRGAHRRAPGGDARAGRARGRPERAGGRAPVPERGADGHPERRRPAPPADGRGPRGRGARRAQRGRVAARRHAAGDARGQHRARVVSAT
jgi:serine protease Do